MPDDHVVAAEAVRPPQESIPQSKYARNRLLEAVRTYAQQEKLVPPLTLAELRTHTWAAMDKAGIDRKYTDFAAVLMNNEAWRETVAAIPNDKRLLLLSRCLRNSGDCPASFDEIGLLCEQCGRCLICAFKEKAEQLAYAVLVAEGSPVVTALIESGRIEAVIGVSCLSVLQRVFPYMEAGAVPGIAIPLLYDGCADTTVDLDWVWEAIYLTVDESARRLDFEAMHQQVDAWFTAERLMDLIVQDSTCQKGVAGERIERTTEQVAVEWIAHAGKRWRPFLTACTYNALCTDDFRVDEQDLRKVAVAVECFHKASLIHDDIEDGDAERYGQKTLHAEYGVPIALNVGDLLLGEGYRLLAEVNIPETKKVKLLDTASRGHRNLCLGQGCELAWIQAPAPLTVSEVLDIFRLKTAPAFEVALTLGAILAGSDEQVVGVLKQYSDCLGIAYQIRDDLDDLDGAHSEDIFAYRRPSILQALAYENAVETEKKQMERLLGDSPTGPDRECVRRIIGSPKVAASALDLMETYKAQAITSCISLRNAGLKRLLRRVVGRMFNDFDMVGCCDTVASKQ